MVGYILKNTLTEHGHVARGICQMDSDGFLTGIQERTHIEKRGEKAVLWKRTEKSVRKFPQTASFP